MATKTYTADELKDVLAAHAKWRNGDTSGVRANLQRAYLQGAYLQGANLQGANLQGAYLQRANLQGANLQGANLEYATMPHFQLCPEIGTFTAYKKAGGAILTLVIPEDARRVCSLAGRKCRAEKVLVVAAETLEGEPITDGRAFASSHDGRYVYRVGETMTPDRFCDDIRFECSNGIHFFITKREAREY